jgi:hypothetical protein
MDPLLLTTFWDVVIWICIAFIWVMVIWMFISIFTDIFRRRDHSGVAKALWTVFIIILPFLGILIYMITRPADATAEQDAQLLAAQQRAMGYSAAAEIEKAQQLLAADAITQAEFDKIKAAALQ